MIPTRTVLKAFRTSPTLIMPRSIVNRCFASTKPDDHEPTKQELQPTPVDPINAQEEKTSNENKTETATEAKIVVFGGNGFVGSRICRQASDMGLHVISVNRSGRPSWLKDGWANNIEWINGDAMQPECYVDILRGALGAISCVGAFGNNATMYRICGEANIRIIETAARVQVPRFAFISVHHETLPGFVKQIGYFRGKIDAEAALRRSFGSRGVAIRPFFIYGTRNVAEGIGIPLQLMGIPLERALNFIPNAKKLASSIPVLGSGLVPPVKVESVAKAAVHAVTDIAMTNEVFDVWEIAKL